MRWCTRSEDHAELLVTDESGEEVLGCDLGVVDVDFAALLLGVEVITEPGVGACGAVFEQ